MSGGAGTQSSALIAQDSFHAAFLTHPDRIQRVQTRMYFTIPCTLALTRCRLGSQRRLVLLLA
jgi:hypothetical protein